MQPRLTLSLVLTVGILLVAAGAEAQPPEASLVEAPQEPSLDEALASARTRYDVGLGLTLGGTATTGLGAALMFGLGGWGGIIGGGVVTGLGGAAFLIGVPIWIVGAVRADILRSGASQAEAAERWETAGIVVFCLGLVMATMGATMMGTYDGDGGVLTAGLSLLPVGVALSAFVGLPLWAEGARF